LDLTGKEFNRLTVIRFAYTKNKHSFWYVTCNCNPQNEFIIRGSSLRRGSTQSCGCLQKEVTKERLIKENIYDLSGEYGIGYDYKNNIFTFNLEDHEKIKDYCWHKNKRGYFVCSKNLEEDDQRQTIRLHRIIMGINDPEIEIDHINRDKSNNRKYNLREADHRQNNVNKNLNSNNSSGCQGVYYNKKLDKWHSQIYYNKKKIHIGYFDDLDDAIKSRIKYEIKIENFNNNHLYEKYGYHAKITK
jgi:hypothetical protein